ncbi:LysR substrate-binding domain-containing protein [Paraburkholderia sediminicola]|uniref:LysR substrate-binding domain-containing protein n=1 Tax=Paraburkholderia sediminicola TaxID=458836 RepID=UPI0038BA5DA4
MDKFQSMEVFVRVVDLNGFARAADTLNMARPVVTRVIKDLEAFLGVRLMNRTTRRLHLTDEGRLYYESAVEILKAVEDSESAYRLGASTPKGTLKIDVQTSVAKCLIVPRIKDFHERFPKIDLILGTGDRIIDLIEEGVDCAIRVGALEDSSMIARQVGIFNRVTVASPDYIRRVGTPVALDDLHAHRVVHYTATKVVKQPSFDFLSDSTPTTVRMISSVQVNDSDTYIELAKAGFGLIQPARFAVESELESGGLVEVLPSFPVPIKPISLVFPQRSQRAPKLMAFITWVSEAFASSKIGLKA